MANYLQCKLSDVNTNSGLNPQFGGTRYPTPDAKTGTGSSAGIQPKSMYGTTNGAPYILEILDIKDTIGTRVIKHQILNRDGALTQVIGSLPRTITLKTYWWGSNNYSDHFSFLDYIDPFKSGISFYVLTHPKYGEMTGRIENYSVMADDRQEYAEIDFTFIEDAVQTNSGATASTFDNMDALSQLIKYSYTDYANSVGFQLQTLGLGNLVGKLFDPLKPFAKQLQGYSTQIRNFGSDIDNNLAALNGYVTSITSSLSAVGTTITTLQDIPTILFNEFTTVVNSIVQVASSASTVFIPPMGFNLNQVSNIFTGQNAPFFKSAWYQASAPILINTHMKNVVADVSARARAQSLTDQPSFDVLGNLVNPNNPATNIISLKDIQADSKIVRAYAQQAIDMNPNNYTLKTMINTLQSYIASVQQQILQTYQITISPQPLAVLLMNLGKDYHNADEILALNPSIQNPNNVSGTITVYV